MSLNVKNIQSLSDIIKDFDKESQEYAAISKIVDHFQPIVDQLLDANHDELIELDESLSVQTNEHSLFSELGKLVREVFNKRRKMEGDLANQLESFSDLEMTGATERLRHILEVTDRAAHRTMDLTEKVIHSLDASSPERENLMKHIESALKTGNAEEQSKVLEAALQHLQKEKTETNENQTSLTDILIAQDYQDLTGQVIGKIITLISETETHLLNLLQKYSAKPLISDKGKKKEEPKKEPQGGQLIGPLPENSEKRQDQDSIDKLLAELGFD